MSLTTRRTVFALAVFSVMPLLVACPKKEVPPFDAGPAVPPPDPDTGTTTLVPLDDDSGADVDAAEAGKKPTGPYVPSNVLRLKQCCAALRNNAKSLGASPEAGLLIGAAAQCDAMAAQVGPSGTAPELGVLRNLLKGKTVPAACAGF